MRPPGHVHGLATLIFSSDFLGFFLLGLQPGSFVLSYFPARRSSRPLCVAMFPRRDFLGRGRGVILAVWRRSACHAVGSRCRPSLVRVTYGSDLPSPVWRCHRLVRFPRLPGGLLNAELCAKASARSRRGPCSSPLGLGTAEAGAACHGLLVALLLATDVPGSRLSTWGFPGAPPPWPAPKPHVCLSDARDTKF